MAQLRSSAFAATLLLAMFQRNYHFVEIADFPRSDWTHVFTKGRVVQVRREKDGDTHIRLEPLNLPACKGDHVCEVPFVIAECIPKLPCKEPKVGSTVWVYGISRRDGKHGFWEIHPVEQIR